MILQGEGLILRSYKHGDAPELVRIASNPKIARNMVDEFHNPYALKDAEEWVNKNLDEDRQRRVFAIIIDGKIAGNIGFSIKDRDKIHTATIGYWLGEEYWGRGIAAHALRMVTDYAFKNFNLERIEATVYTWNPASAKVLEKAGYKFEGTLRKSTLKAGTVIDEWLYSKIREDK